MNKREGVTLQDLLDYVAAEGLPPETVIMIGIANRPGSKEVANAIDVTVRDGKKALLVRGLFTSRLVIKFCGNRETHEPHGECRGFPICDTCGGIMHEGEPTARIPGIGFMHETCPDADL